jgi:hypothetical protein
MTGVATGTLTARVEEFIALRRGLGYRSPSQERALRAFGRHLDHERYEGPIRLESSLDWATKTASTDPCNPARRLTMVRGFLRPGRYGRSHRGARTRAAGFDRPSETAPHLFRGGDQ